MSNKFSNINLSSIFNLNIFRRRRLSHPTISQLLSNNRTVIMIINEDITNENFIKDYLFFKNQINTNNIIFITENLPFEVAKEMVPKSSFYTINKEFLATHGLTIKSLLSDLKNEEIDTIYCRGEVSKPISNVLKKLNAKLTVNFGDTPGFVGKQSSNFWSKDSDRTILSFFKDIKEENIAWKTDKKISNEIKTVINELGIEPKKKFIILAIKSEIPLDTVNDIVLQVNQEGFDIILFSEIDYKYSKSISGLNDVYLSSLTELSIAVISNDSGHKTLFNNFSNNYLELSINNNNKEVFELTEFLSRI